MPRDKDKVEDEPVLLHAEPRGGCLRTGCMVMLVVFAILAILALGPLREVFTVLWHGPGPM